MQDKGADNLLILERVTGTADADDVTGTKYQLWLTQSESSKNPSVSVKEESPIVSCGNRITTLRFKVNAISLV